jgi:hypothetical protein
MQGINDILDRLRESEDEDVKALVEETEAARQANGVLLKRLQFCENLLNQIGSGLQNYSSFSQALK